MSGVVFAEGKLPSFIADSYSLWSTQSPRIGRSVQQYVLFGFAMEQLFLLGELQGSLATDSGRSKS